MIQVMVCLARRALVFGPRLQGSSRRALSPGVDGGGEGGESDSGAFARLLGSRPPGVAARPGFPQLQGRDDEQSARHDAEDALLPVASHTTREAPASMQP